MESFTEHSGQVAFSGNQGTIAVIGGHTFSMYDGLKGTRLCGDVLPSPFNGGLVAHWTREGSLWLVTGSINDGHHAIDIWDLRVTSNSPLSLVKSFPAPPHNNNIFFSPVSFHASFVAGMEVIILDVRDSRVLFRTEAAQSLYTPPGRFSPDGRFFACRTFGNGVRVWKNTSTGYTPWSNLQPRLPFTGLSFSPTSNSVLSWGSGGIQLSNPDNRLSPPTPNNIKSNHQQGGHLVAYSADGVHIATARRENRIVTILDPLSGTPRQSIDTNMQIQDIRIVGNTVFVADGHKLIGWDLDAGGDAYNARRTIVDETVAIGVHAKHLMISHDCSRIAFTSGESLFLYDVQAREVISEYTVGEGVIDMRLSPNRHGVQLVMCGAILHVDTLGDTYNVVELEMTKDGRFADDAPGGRLGDGWSTDRLLRSQEYRIVSGSEWVEDSGGGKLLWLPPSWRTVRGLDVRWDGNLLAFVGSRRQKPIIIEFQP